MNMLMFLVSSLLSFIYIYLSLASYLFVFQNFACAKDGPPHVGTDVEVLWSDGKRYSGQFHGTNHQLMFTVSVVIKY